MFFEGEEDVAALFGALDDAAGAFAVADVDDLNLRVHVLLLQVVDDRGVGAHAQADEAVVEGQVLDGAVGKLDDKFVVADLLQAGPGHLGDVVLLHLGSGVALGDGIQAVADDGKEVDDRAVRAALGHEFHDVEADSAAADDDDLLAGHVGGIVVLVGDHAEDGLNPGAFLVDAVMQAGDGRKGGAGAGGVHDDVGVEALHQVDGRFRALEDEEVAELGGAADHIFGEVRQTDLVRDLGDLDGKTAELLLLLNEEGRTSNLCRRACRLEAGCAAADDDDVAGLVDLALFVLLAGGDGGVDRAADGLVEADAVAGAADVAGDALAQVVLMAELDLVAPVGIRDQAAAHADEVRVAAGQDILCDLGIADIAHGDAGLAVFFLHGLCHVGAPAVGQVIGIDLELDGLVEACGDIKDVDFLLEVLEVIQGILECVAALYELVGADADEDGEEGADLAADFLNDELGEAGAVLGASAEFIGPLVHDGGEELADQVGVAAVDLDAVKAGGLGALGGLAVLFDDLIDLFLFQRARNFAAFLGRYVGGGDGLHADPGRDRGSAGVVDLDTDAGAVLVDLLTEQEQARDIVVLVNAQLGGAVGALRGEDTGVLHHQEAGAALGAQLVVVDVQETHFTGLLAEVGAHGGHHDAVLHGHAADGEGFKDVRIIALHIIDSPFTSDLHHFCDHTDERRLVQAVRRGQLQPACASIII